jgi:hypothetical protein
VLAGESDISLCLVEAQAGPVVTALAAAGLTELFESFASIDECDPTMDVQTDAPKSTMTRVSTGSPRTVSCVFSSIDGR